MQKKDELNEKLRGSHLIKDTNKYRALLIMNRKRIEELENEEMDEDKFWNYMNNDDNEFQYGRNVLTDKTLDDIMRTPYQKFELTTMPELTFQELDKLDGRIKSDDGSQKRFLKAKVEVI